ncbi:MAG: CpaF family protein [Gammaproteobacteria bacterium]|jgi:pilus assembly protein CpaF
MNSHNTNWWSRKKSTAKFESPFDGALSAANDQNKGAVANSPAQFEDTSEFVDLKVSLHQQLLDLINLSAIDQVDPKEFRLETSVLIKELLEREQIPMSSTERSRLVDDIIDEVLGLGPIEPLLKDPSVSDILVNTSQQIFVERHGVLERVGGRFKDNKHLIRIIDKIVSRVGRRIDESSPLVDARLPDGSRVNAIIPPLAVDGPLLSIRKFAQIPYDLEKLVENGTVSQQMAQILAGLVKCKVSILISGGTGSGKTTFLNACSRFIDDRERVVSIEDAAELQLQQTHVARLETRPSNIEGQGEYTQRDLVKNALRMRPDRIIVGEVRGPEAFDMLQAMNTGHDGSMTTIHANTARDALSRLEQMIGMVGFDLPAKAVRSQIASAIHVVVQVNRFEDGTRRLVSLQEITGMEGDVITMQEIFSYRRTGLDENGRVSGRFEASGIRPNFADLFQTHGFEIDPKVFAPEAVLS